MDKRIPELVSALDRPSANTADLRSELDWLASTDDSTVVSLLEQLYAAATRNPGFNEQVLVAVFRKLLQRAHPEHGGQRKISPELRQAAILLYARLPRTSRSRHLLLRLLSQSREPDDLRAMAEVLSIDPPETATDVAIVISPLFQVSDYDPHALFPRLLDAMNQLSVASVILDLANRVTREGMVDEHPACECCQRLATLLGQIVQRLGAIEERPGAVSGDEHELSRIVSDGVTLAVSLCDALGLIGDPASVGKLNQAMSLRHRRLRTEAAAALARLGDETGRSVLLSLAAEPVARLRVLAYADELDLADRVPEEFATSQARAESELALWLAQPSQLGFPPSRLELIDSRVLYWPGYDEPVECFLFRFAYELPDGEYSNIGIAGPLCHAFEADLADLPPGDIYSIFAGWQAEHDEIHETEVDGIADSRSLDVVRLERRMRDQGYDSIQPLTLGSFFGEKVLIAKATRESIPGIAVATADSVLWLPTQGRLRPFGPHEAYCLFKGRRLLQTFNP